MRKIVICGVMMAVLAVLVLPALPAMAEDEAPGMLAWITHFETKAGMSSELEAGMKAHNALHVKQNDPVAIHTWEIITGPRSGEYMRASLGQHWKDFDGDAEHLAADSADSAKNITPYVDSAVPTIWSLLPKVSLPEQTIPALSRIIQFNVRYGHEDAFQEAIGKIHQALSANDWDPYLWFALVDGGRMPTYMVILPRDSFAGFAPGEKNMEKTMMETYGEEAATIFKDLQATTESLDSHIAAYRPDLSYLPAPASE